MEELMSAGNPMSGAVVRGLQKKASFVEGQPVFDGVAGVDEALTLLPPLFTPFRGEAVNIGSGLEGGVATDRDRLLMEHLPTVRYIARRIHERLPQHVELDDLVSAGVVGLIDAFAKFDHNKKVQFKSYAQFRIRGAILDSLRTLDWSPRELRRKGRAVEEAIRSVTQKLGRAPVEQEIANEMELSLEDYQQLLGDLKGLEIGSLHMERSEDSGDEELAYIPGSPEENPLLRCMKGEMKQCLIDAIEDLPEKERMVLTLYYYEELTMKEIGQTLGVVESRVSQIHSSAVLRLRVALANLGSGGAVIKKKTAATKRLSGAR
jgi:RNA polymerase sigma factor for flagellar operon FliA